MNRSIRSAATSVTTTFASLAVFVPAVAVAQGFTPQIYGLLDASVGHQRTVGSSSGFWRVDSGTMTESFVGIRGAEDLGGGLRARFQLESFIRIDQGIAGRFVGDAFWGRNSFIGLQGAFGSTVLGRNATPFFMATASFNPFGESFGFSPSIRQYYGAALLGDRSWNNSISYTNNATDKDLKFNLAYNAGEGAPGSTGRNVGASVFYILGPVVLSGAAQRVRNSSLPLPAGFNRQNAWQLGATYDIRVVRLFAQYGKVDTHAGTSSKTSLYQLGASVPIGQGSVIASYGRSNGRFGLSDSTDRTISVGYDYNLSKGTDLYAAYLNERQTSLTSGNLVAAGMRLRF